MRSLQPIIYALGRAKPANVGKVLTKHNVTVAEFQVLCAGGGAGPRPLSYQWFSGLLSWRDNGGARSHWFTKETP